MVSDIAYSSLLPCKNNSNNAKSNSRRSMTNTSKNKNTGTFHLFVHLTDDVQFLIFTFVAEAPFEKVEAARSDSSLVDTLPLVSRKFSSFANDNQVWKMALSRAIASDDIWRRASTTTSIKWKDNQKSFREVYRNIYQQEIEFTGPVFILGMDQEPIPEMYTLYLFEPRYRFMVHQLLRTYHEWEALPREEAGEAPPMQFLHAHKGLGQNMHYRKKDALLVRIVRCAELLSGHFDVTLHVDALVRMDRVWVEPNTGHLYHAAGRKIKYMDENKQSKAETYRSRDEQPA